MTCCLENGLTQRETAKKLNRSSSTISREIKQNSTEVRNCRYLGHRTQMHSDERKKISRQKIRLSDPKVRKYVKEKLKAGFSPEQITGKIGKDLPGCKTNHESIYLFVYQDCPELTQFWIWGRHKPRKRVVKIPNRVMIDKSPQYINDRKN